MQAPNIRNKTLSQPKNPSSGPQGRFAPSIAGDGSRAIFRVALLLVCSEWVSTVFGAPAESAKSIGLGAMFGPFHVVLLHFPIGFLALTGLFEFWARLRPDQMPRRVVGAMLALSAGSAWVAASTGLLRGQSGEFDASTLWWHRLLGLSVAGLVSVAWLLHRRGTAVEAKVPGPGYLATLMLSLGCLGAAGHFGGNLTHGEGFLTQNLLQAISGPSNKEPAKTAAAPSGDLFTTVIAPALEKKCHSCHGPQKQKGGIRLDQPEELLKASSKHPPVVLPRQAMTSRLVEVLLLPEDSDDRMPPTGKVPLTAEETLAIIRWIQDGAVLTNSPSLK